MSSGATTRLPSLGEFEAPVGSSHEPPVFRTGMVPRPRLTAVLARERGHSVVLLSAPPGYGKTTLLSEWAAVDDRPFAWVTVGRRESDPVALLTALAEALAEVEPAAGVAVEMLNAPVPHLDAVIPTLLDALRGASAKLVLVIDDAHMLDSEDAAEVIEAVGGGLPAGAQLAIAGRSPPHLHLGRLRAHRRALELGMVELAMNRTEVGTLLEKIGVSLDPPQLDEVMEKTEGWPVAIYLAGLAMLDSKDSARGIADFAGDDRVVAEYLRDEFTSRISAEQRSFLMRVSILDRFSGELCDAVLDRSGSDEMLRALARSNLLIVPLDRKSDWFRFHGLLRTALTKELQSADAEAESELHRRASTWYVEHGDPDRAVEHLIAAGDVERAGDLIYTLLPDYAARGRNSTVMFWLSRFTERQVESCTALALAAFHSSLAGGQGSRAEAWLKAAAKAGGGSLADPAEGPYEGAVWVARAELSRGGVACALADAEHAGRVEPEESPFQGVCSTVKGSVLLISGDVRGARDALKQGARVGAVFAPMIQVICLAELAALALEDGDPGTAEILASQARAQVERSRLVNYPPAALPIALSAYVMIEGGHLHRADSEVARAARLLDQCDEMPPWLEAVSHVFLARALLRLGRPAKARKHLAAVPGLIDLEEAPLLRRWVEEATSRAMQRKPDGRGSDLTPAELRLLGCLPTHLSLRQIAEEFVVSTNTVKSQAQAVYRKLGVSSRAEAVNVAREAGLLRE
ncbi:MAG: AAA family ATPase [Solirubrobacterales bacterium]